MEPLCVNSGKNSEPPEMMAMSFEADAMNGKSLKDKCAGSVHRLFTDVMPNLLVHPLDPLSWCARSVVSEFARQSRHLGHELVTSIVANWEARMTNVKYSRPLEIFFPFDPYLLRRSADPLDLAHTYVSWLRGHPTCIVPDDGNNGRVVDIESDSEESMDDSDDSDDESSLILSSSSGSDGMRRTRFGSMPDSSMSSGGRRYLTRKLPGALKASIIAHTATGGSPTGGIPIMHDSPSTDRGGSPWGMSPSYFPMSHTSNDRFPASFPKKR